MRSDTVPTVNTARFDKLVTLLKELFQLDRPDLDFGFFRIMHAKSAEVTRFLERDLLPQVQTAFSEYGSGDRKRLKEEYRSAVEQAEKLGAPDPETLPGVRDAKRRLAEAGESTDSLEADVYDHLYRFFRRYYSEGDFLSRRVYKPGVYAVPYEGEEVKLHWANADQYYIKTDEYLRNYAFKLRPDDDADPMRVHFRLADAAEAEHGNIKSSAVRKRVFVLCSGDFIGEEEGELVIRFEYRPASPDDGASNGKKKPPKQKDLVDLAESKVMQQLEGRDRFARWARALSEHHVLADGSKADYTCLRAHLNRYTARNTYDYFIHKDLGAFLRRELDFYIKNEVIHLDDIESESAPRVAQYLSKIRVIRRIAHKIIDFLAQLEGFQKRLWLKKKFVVDASWCVRIGCIPEEFHAEITANEAQREEWVKLCAINEIESDLAAPGYTVPLTSRFLKAHSTLMLDTKHFSADFTARLLSTIDNLDDAMDGVLVHSENFQALSLMQARYRGRVYCIYIDPPYNTGNDGFVYRDNYQHSSWAAMAAQGLPLAKRLGTRSSAIFASIDDAEQPMLRFLLDEAWGPANHVADMCWAAGRKNDSRFVSVSHDYILVYATDLEHLRESKAKWWQRKRGLDDIYLQHRRLIRKHKTDYGTITNNLKKWFRDLPDSHPAKAHRHYSHVDRRGVYFPDNISWPGGAGPKYEVLHPVTKKPVRVPAAGWRFSKPETMQQHIEEDRIHFGADETKVPCRKSYLTDHEYESPYSVFYRDGRAATNRLRNVLGSADFGYPKDDTIIAECVGMVTSEEGTVLDYFAVLRHDRSRRHQPEPGRRRPPKVRPRRDGCPLRYGPAPPPQEDHVLPGMEGGQTEETSDAGRGGTLAPDLQGRPPGVLRGHAQQLGRERANRAFASRRFRFRSFPGATPAPLHARRRNPGKCFPSRHRAVHGPCQLPAQDQGPRLRRKPGRRGRSDRDIQLAPWPQG